MISIKLLMPEDVYLNDVDAQTLASKMKGSHSDIRADVVSPYVKQLPKGGLVFLDIRMPREILIQLIERYDEIMITKPVMNLYIAIPIDMKSNFNGSDVKYKHVREYYSLPEFKNGWILIHFGYKDISNQTNGFGHRLWGLSKMGKL